MEISADIVLLLTRVQCEGSKVDVCSTDESLSWQILLEAFKLGVHNIKLEKLGALEDVVEVFLSEWDNHLVISTRPVWIAAGIDDVGLEV